jgi:glucans biosynthesis protein C
MKPNDSVSSPSLRRYDLDWLRTLAVLLLVPFHALLVFVQNPNSVVYLKDGADSILFDRIAGFIHQYHMPVLFMVAGMSTAFALSRRSGGQYLRERVSRLLIPFLFGIVALVPPMTYITQIARGNRISFWQHYATFFTLGPDLNGIQGTFTPAHLWFILYLMVYSLVALPLFLWLCRDSSQGVVRAMAWAFEKPLALLGWGVLLALAAATDLLGDMNPVYYFFLFLFGYLLMTDARYQKAIDRDWPVMLFLAVLFEVLRQTWNPAFAEWSLPWILRELAMQLNRWVWVLAILGIGHRWLNRGGKVLKYLSEAAYPFYILHFLILTGVSYFIVQVQAAILVKYLLIISITYASTFLVYEGARRVALFRFLLGMHRNESKSSAVTNQWMRV